MTFWLQGSPAELMGYVMLRLGSKNVARLSGCFCRLFSLITPVVPVAPPSGRLIDRGTGDAAGDDPVLTAPGGDTNRLKPNVNRPDNALSVPPTDDCGVDGPAPAVSSSCGSNSDFAPPPTTVTMSRRRLVRVGLAGGGGGLRMPLVGGLGRRGAGDGCGGAVAAAFAGAADAVGAADRVVLSESVFFGKVSAPDLGEVSSEEGV